MYFDKIFEQKGTPYVIGGLVLAILVPSLLLTLTPLGSTFIFASILSIFLSGVLIGVKRTQQHCDQLNGSALEQTIREIKYRSGRLFEQEHILVSHTTTENLIYPNLTQRGLFSSGTTPTVNEPGVLPTYRPPLYNQN